MGRDRHGRPDEVESDEDDLPAYEIDSADLHHGVIRSGAGCLKIDDAETGEFVRVAGHGPSLKRAPAASGAEIPSEGAILFSADYDLRLCE